jgi:hypothetical protein
VHFGCHLAKLLLINTGKSQGSLILLNTSLGCQTFSFGVNFSRQRKLDRVGIAQREDNLLSLHVCLVANAHDIHLLAEPFSDTDDSVISQRASQTMQSSLLVRGALRPQLVAL